MAKKVLFIGAGNMGFAILRSFISGGRRSFDISILDPNLSSEKKVLLLGCKFYEEFSELINTKQFDVIVIAVKPQIFDDIASDIGSIIRDDGLVVSIMAGVETNRINSGLGKDIKIIRCMPNLAALVNYSVNVAFITDDMPAQKLIYEELFHDSGPIKWIDDEDLIHKTTALSGSGPAYFLAFVEALTRAGESLGLTEEQASDLAVDTLLGTAALLKEERSPEALRERVTSKGGTTAAAISIFMQDNRLDDLVEEALIAAEKRSREL